MPPDPASEHTWLTLAELGELLHVTKRHIRRLVSQNRIPSTKVRVGSGSILLESRGGSTTTATSSTGGCGVAGRLEHPQLFDPSQPNRDLSPNETSTRVSRYETSSPSSRFETPPALSRIETSGVEIADSQGLLQAIEDAAELVAAAHAQLDVAIDAARVAGVVGVISAPQQESPSKVFTAAIGNEERPDVRLGLITRRSVAILR